MIWKKYSFTTTTDKVDIMSALLGDAGIEGIQVEDHQALSEEDTKGMFIDILPDVGEDDGQAVISFYLDPDDPQLEEKLAAAREVTGDAELTESRTEDIDWINNWKEFFHPLSVGNILVKPTWEDIPAEDQGKIVIDIDPGTAFGTGGHETTQLCMLQLERYIRGNEEVLDVGTGSGILGIAALKLGASHVMSTDLDENAIDAVGENIAVNGIEKEDFEVIWGNILDDRKVQDAVGYAKYDIVVANILAPVIIALVSEIPQHMKSGAVFITSGIIDMKENEVREAFEASDELEIVEINHLGEWVNITAVRK